MTKVIEAVRQLRGEAHPKVQVKNCRPGPRPRHRRLARHAARQRHRHPGAGVAMATKERKIPAPQPNPETQALLGGGRRRAAPPEEVPRVRPGPLLSARAVSLLRERPHRVAAGVGPGQHLLLERDAAGGGALRHRLRDAGGRRHHDDQYRGLRSRRASASASAVRVVFTPTDGGPPRADLHAGLSGRGSRHARLVHDRGAGGGRPRRRDRRRRPGPAALAETPWPPSAAPGSSTA